MIRPAEWGSPRRSDGTCLHIQDTWSAAGSHHVTETPHRARRERAVLEAVAAGREGPRADERPDAGYGRRGAGLLDHSGPSHRPSATAISSFFPSAVAPISTRMHCRSSPRRMLKWTPSAQLHRAQPAKARAAKHDICRTEGTGPARCGESGAPMMMSSMPSSFTSPADDTEYPLSSAAIPPLRTKPFVPSRELSSTSDCHRPHPPRQAQGRREHF